MDRGGKDQQPETPETARTVTITGFLQQQREEILRSWETRVTSEAREIELAGLLLRDDIPGLLDDLAAWLTSDAAPQTSLLATQAFKHVMQRFDEGVSLAQLLREYRLLRETITAEVLGAEAAEQERTGASGDGGRVARIEELARLNAGLDVVLSQSVLQFVEERERRGAAVRKRAEQELGETEARVHSVTNNLPDAVVYQIEARPDGARRFTYLGGGVADLFGCTAEEALVDAGALYSRFLEADGRRLAESERESLIRLVPFKSEARVRRANGEIGWVYAASAPRRRPDDSIVWDGVVVDITERKRTEEALRLSEERLRAHMDNSPLAIVEFDPDFRITRWSRQAERLFGWPAEEILGKAVGELRWVHEDDLEQVARESAGLRSGERPSSLHVNRNYRKDGSVVHCEWYSSALYGSDGSLVSVLSQVLDITERKRNEVALAEANERLREADQRKNEFLAVLSHELRNPLAPIRNCTYILERAAPGGDQAKRALAVIDRQAGQLARLVDDLLDVTRITRSKIQLQRQTLELNELVRRTMEDHRSMFEKVEVHLELDPSPAPLFVSADWNRLAQVVGNLLLNAAKFTPRGGTASVTIQPDPAAGRAVLRITDTGVGMAPETISRLFQPFTQADATLDRSRGGLGLGLALVKGLVELHGGDITARSGGLGKGSELVVRLPLAMVEAAAPATPEAVTGGRRRVLVIDDNIDAADSLLEVLEFAGQEVEVAYNGPDGIARARAFRPDIVLCDIGLPGMDGYEVARAFRDDVALSGLHLVAVSGYALPEDLERASAAGFERHLAKPATLEKLGELFRSLAGPEGR